VRGQSSVSSARELTLARDRSSALELCVRERGPTLSPGLGDTGLFIVNVGLPFVLVSRDFLSLRSVGDIFVPTMRYVVSCPLQCSAMAPERWDECVRLRSRGIICYWTRTCIAGCCRQARVGDKNVPNSSGSPIALPPLACTRYQVSQLHSSTYQVTACAPCTRLV